MKLPKVNKEDLEEGVMYIYRSRSGDDIWILSMDLQHYEDNRDVLSGTFHGPIELETE